MRLLIALLTATLVSHGQGFGVSQTGRIVINDAQFVAGNTIPAKASPYPSTISISNQFVGTIQKAAIVLPIRHDYANDVDVLLVAPNGEKIVLLSDVALNGVFSGASITIDASATADFPQSLTPGASVPAGSYKPANFAPEDTFPDSVSAPYTGTLGALAGLAPGGDWRLFVIDDKPSDAGEISGWELKLWTTPVLGAMTNTVNTLENVPVTFTAAFNDTDTPADSVTVRAVALDKNLVSDTNIVVSATGKTRNITVTPNLNRNGSTTLEVTFNDGITTITNTTTLNIGAVNQAPTIALNTNRVEVSAGGFVTTAIATVADVDHALDDISVFATSGDTNLVPANFVVDVTRTGATRTLLVAPRGTATGTTELQIFSRDTGTSNNISTSRSLSVTVNPVTQALFSSVSNLVIPDNNTTASQTIGVSNVFGAIGKVTASINGLTHPNPADVRVRLRAPGGAAEVLLLDGNGGSDDAIGTWLALDDAAANALPATLVPGTYRPSSALSAFNDISPNGNWTLEAVDTTAGPAGDASIRGGVTLRIFTKPEVRGLINTNLAENTSKTFNFTVADFDGQVTNVVASSSNDSIARAAVTLTGTNGVLTVTGRPDQNGTVTVTVTARDNSGYTGSQTVSVVVNPVNTPPNISPISKQLTYAGLPLGPVEFTVNDTGASGTATDETPAANIIVTARSSNQKLLPDGNIVLGGSGVTRNLTLYPVGNSEGQVTVTLTATDAGIPTPARTSTTEFVFEVAPPASPLFYRSEGILIADSGAGGGATNAAPYPAPIPVSGQVGLIRQVQVTLVGVQHPSPQDLGVLLVGPNGDQVILMSGAGGTSAIRDLNLIFSDSASGALPAVGPLVAGTFRPSNLNSRGAADFPGTGSSRPLSSSLSVFNGIVPNGTWSLYVRDFTGNTKGDGQQIAAGWMINFVTEANLAAIPQQETPEDTAKRVGITIGDNQPGITVTLTASSDNPTIVPNTAAALKFEPGVVASASQTLVITPASNQSGDVNITVTAQVGTGTPSSRTFLLKVTPVNDEPSITGAGSNNRSRAAGLVDGPLIVNVNDVESPRNSIVLTASSSDTRVLPNDNILLRSRNDGSGDWEITLVPNGIETGITTVTLSAQVGTERPGTKSFTYTVTRNRSYLSEEGRIVIRDNAPSLPYPSVTRVRDLPGLVSKVSVTLLGFTHTFPDDANLLLVSPDGSKSVVLLSDAGGGAPTNSVSNVTLTLDQSGSDLSTEGRLTSGTFKPGNFGAPAFASPAPSTGYSSTLDAFNGTNPNGDWKLYAYDDTFSDSGSIERGWVLVIETAPSIAPIAAQTTREDTPLQVLLSIADADTDAKDVRAWATSLTQSLVNDTNLVVSPTNTFERFLTLTPSRDQSGTNLITVFVADNRVTNSTAFALNVTAVDDPPLIGTSTNLVRINEDTVTNIVFRVSDVDSVLSVTNATLSSVNNTLLPNSTNNIVLNGSVSIAAGTTNEIIATVTPAANQFGESLLTFTMRDATTPSISQVTLAVTSVNDVPTISVTNNAYSVVAGQTLANIPVTVGDVETPARNLVLSATSSDQGVVPNANIVLGGVNENRLLSITPIGVATGTATITLRVRDELNAESTTNVVISVTRAPGNTYANTSSVTIRDNNTSNPYGTSITVPATQGAIHTVQVVLDGLTHNAPDDLDVLLVSPTGQKVLLLSDVGGSIPITNGRIVIDDAASNQVPDAGPLVSGSYQPSNSGEGDTFPSPAPAAPYASNLASLRGANPAGEWRLFIVDDTGTDSGTLAGGWALRIVTAPRLVTTTPSPVVWDEDDTATVTLEVNDLDSGSKYNQLEFFSESTNTGLLSSVAFSRLSGDPNSDGGPWVVQAVLTPTANVWGTNLLTLGVRRTSDRATSTVTLGNTVRLVNDAPQISRITAKTTDENVPIDVSFLVTDVDTAPRDISIRATSGDGSLIADNRLLFVGGTNFLSSLPGSELVLTLNPNTNRTGTAQITLSVTDNSTNPPARTATSSFSLTVTPFNDPPTISAIPDVSIPSGSSTTNILFTVADVDTSTVKLTATSSDQRLVPNGNIRFFLDAAGTQPATDFHPVGDRWVRVTSEVGRRGSAVISVTATDGAKNSLVRTFTVNVVESRERSYAASAPIVIRDNNTASVYPSTITVSDLVGDVANVRVRVTGFAHSFPSDVDMLLVSPSGKSVILMSDAGGGTSVTNRTFTFTDSASEDVPSSTVLNSGEYRPKNYDSAADNFPAPASTASLGATLSTLNGSIANGEWRLFVVDDTSSDAGFINGGWELFLTTQPRIVGLADVTVREGQAFSVPFTIVEEDFAEVNFTFTSASTNSVLLSTNNIAYRGSGTNWTLNATPTQFLSGRTRVTVNARNPYGQTSSGSFNVTVTEVNDPPTITPVADISIAAGTSSTPVVFNYSDPETPQKDLIFTVASSNPDLIPTNNVFVLGGFLRVAPVGNRTGTSVITLSVSDGNVATGPVSTSFTVTVTPTLHAQYANSSAITVAESPGVGRATPYPSTIEVSRLRGTVSQITVTLAELSHAYPSDFDVLLVGPQGQKVTLLSDAGGSERLTNVRLTFDDAAASAVPFNPSGPIPSGSYKPSNYQGSDEFPDAPAGAFSATLAAFAGTNPNGTWSLYIVDDAQPDGGTVRGGWILNIYTTEPTISSIADVVTDENQAVIVPFTVGDADTALTNLVTSATTTDPALLSLELGGTGSQRTIRITPRQFASGSAQVTVSVSDGASTAETSFNVLVRPVNQAPEIAAINPITAQANRPVVVPFTVTDRDGDTLVVTGTTENPDFGRTRVTGAGPAYALEFVPAGLQGATQIQVVAFDGTVSTTNRVPVTVGPPYELVVSPIPNQVVMEDAVVTIPVTVSGSESGVITVGGVASNTNLVANISTSGSGTNHVLTIRLVEDASGESDVLVTAVDAIGGGSTTFKLTVVPVNDAPVIAPIADQTTVANVPARVTLDVTDKDTPVETLTYTAEFSNSQLIANVRFGLNDDNDVVATVNLIADARGTSSVTVFADDGSTKTARSFLLTVTAPPNRPPVLAPIPDQSTTKNVPARVPIVVTDPDTEITAILYTAEFSNTALVRNVRFGIDNNNNVIATVNLVANEIGTSSVTIFADDGATKVSRSFILTVTEPPNEPPVFGPIEDQITTANTPVTVVLNITDPDTALTDLKFTATASNSKVIAGVTFNATTASVTATVNPVEDATGVSTVTITADDGKNKVSQVFAIAVNEAPEPEFARPTLTTNADGSKTITITWENGGELEWADSAAGPWTATGNKTGSYSEPATAASRVYRIKR